MLLVCSRCLWFNQLSVPESLCKMNNVYNTYLIATLIHNIVQHFLKSSENLKEQC